MSEINKRYAKGHIIAASCEIKRAIQTEKGTLWRVESESMPGIFYEVALFPDGKIICTCKDFENRQETCKHIYGVIFYEVQ